LINEKIISEMREKSVLNHLELVMGVAETISGIQDKKLICTDKRVILYNSKLFGRYECDSFPLEHISRIRFNSGFLSGTMTIKSANNEIKVDMKKSEGKKIQNIINNQMIIRAAKMSGKEITKINPLMTLQLRFINGEIDEDEYLRKMVLL
jgi:hypothetical protein